MSVHRRLLVRHPKPFSVIVWIRQATDGFVNRCIATLCGDAICQNGDVFFLFEITLGHHHRPQSLGDAALAPNLVALKNADRKRENKDGINCSHFPRTFNTFRPKPFLKGP